MGIDEDTADLPKDTPWWARVFIDNVRGAWRLASVQWPVLCAAAIEVYAQDKEQIDAWINATIPAQYRSHLLAAAFLVSVLVRVFKQRSKG